MSVDPPAWALRLVAAVETYEDVHGQPGDGWYCLGGALAAVPEHVRQQAKGFEAAQRMFEPGSLVGGAADGHERTDDVKPEQDGSAPTRDLSRGMCGHHAPTLFGAGLDLQVCELTAGHKGWHGRPNGPGEPWMNWTGDMIVSGSTDE